MNKFLYFAATTAFKLFAKVFGKLYFWAVVWLRAPARNYVYNYVLQNGLPLKRLRERYPLRVRTIGFNGWALKDVHNVGHDGWVDYHKVNKIGYYLWLWLVWGWVDDDSNHDTYDFGHWRRHVQENTWQYKLLGRYASVVHGSPYGNTFDLGDIRGMHPLFNWVPTLIWNTRNTAYNFMYLFHQISDESLVFHWKLGRFELGWRPDGEIDGVKYYKYVFGVD